MAVGFEFLGPATQTIGVNGTGAFLNINGGTAAIATINLQANGSARWLVRKNATTETGSNVGSDFEISARNDDGSASGIPLSISRQKLTVTIGQGATGNVSLAVTGNIGTSVSALTYSTSITPNPMLGRFLTLTVTDGVAFQFINPTFAANGVEFTLDILNSSGGAMGAVTFNNGYKLAGSFVPPANGKRRLYRFYFDGTSWVEVARSAADI